MYVKAEGLKYFAHTCTAMTKTLMNFVMVYSFRKYEPLPSLQRPKKGQKTEENMRFADPFFKIAIFYNTKQFPDM